MWGWTQSITELLKQAAALKGTVSTLSPQGCWREMFKRNEPIKEQKMYLFDSCYNNRIGQWWKLSRENKFLRILETRKGEVLNWNSAFSQHVGKAFFPQSKRTTVEAQHLHPEQPLGCLSKRTRIHGRCESTPVRFFFFFTFPMFFPMFLFLLQKLSWELWLKKIHIF